MSRKKIIIKNTISNISLQLINMATVFILMPLVLSYFGRSVFGINAYIISISILFTFLSFAISMSLMKYIPEKLAKKQIVELNELIVSILPVSAFFYFIAGTLIFTFPYYALGWFNIPEDLQSLTKSIMHLVGVFTFLQFPLPIANGILSGLQHFHLNNKIMIIPIISTFLAYLIVTTYNLSLFYYVLVLQLGILLSLFLKIFYSLRLLPFQLKLLKPKLSTLKEVFGFNLYLIANQISDHLMYTTDKLILQKVSGVISVTNYHIARKTQQMSQSFISLPLGAILPSLSEAFASKDKRFIRKMNIEGTLLYTFLIVPPIAVLFILYEPFIRLWIGSGFENTILAGKLFLLTIMVACPFKIYMVSLTSKARIKEIGWVKFIYSIINVIMSYILAKKIGLIGVIVPTAFYWFVVYPAVLIYTMKDEKFFSVKDLMKVVYSFTPPFLIINFFIYNSPLIDIRNWINFIFYFIVFYLVFLIASYIISPFKEKSYLIAKIIYKFKEIFN